MSPTLPACDHDGCPVTQCNRIEFPRDAEAEVIADKLLELPVETRRTLYLIIHENADTFNGVPFQKNTHPWPPRSRT